jgi:two-component system response regulator LytT
MTGTMRTFIIDDEAPARRELRYFLERTATVEVVGEAANGTAALKGIRETRPQLVFLDVVMPGLSGLELAQFLGELPEPPLLVFATAYDSYALQAFEVDALDFLCKPLTQERVDKTIAKARKALAQDVGSPGPQAQQPLGPCRKIILYRGETIVPTSVERIILARAEEGEVLVRAVDGRYRVRSTLGELELKLAAAGFVRTHRSFLVNINHVSEVVPWFNGSFKLIMDDRERSEAPVSRYHVKELKRHFDF